MALGGRQQVRDKRHKDGAYHPDRTGSRITRSSAWSDGEQTRGQILQRLWMQSSLKATSAASKYDNTAVL